MPLIPNIDAVDIVLGVFVPPLVASVVYGGGYAAGRALSGGQPLLPTTKMMLRYISLFVLGTCYLIIILGTLKFPDWTLWASSAVWGSLVIWLLRWRHRKKKDEDIAREIL